MVSTDSPSIYTLLIITTPQRRFKIKISLDIQVMNLQILEKQLCRMSANCCTRYVTFFLYKY
jgi:hypothetical protein